MPSVSGHPAATLQHRSAPRSSDVTAVIHIVVDIEFGVDHAIAHSLGIDRDRRRPLAARERAVVHTPRELERDRRLNIRHGRECYKIALGNACGPFEVESIRTGLGRSRFNGLDADAVPHSFADRNFIRPSDIAISTDDLDLVNARREIVFPSLGNARHSNFLPIDADRISGR